MHFLMNITRLFDYLGLDFMPYLLVKTFIPDFMMASLAARAVRNFVRPAVRTQVGNSLHRKKIQLFNSLK